MRWIFATEIPPRSNVLARNEDVDALDKPWDKPAHDAVIQQDRNMRYSSIVAVTGT
jgi:hypothetical protein